MPPFAVEFHPLAADEAEAAERWYRERNEIAAGRFQRELDRAIERISERPEAGSPYLSSTRRALLRRFPFFVVYRVRGDNVQICRPCAASAGILASALNGGCGGSKSEVHDRTSEVIRSRTATSSRQAAQRS
jgi:plasmid stabilization system protein ParE